jgi:histidinol dehydrogenase
MAQAEHYPGSAVLLTHSKPYAQAVIAALEQEIKTLSRGEKIREDLAAYSLIVLVKDDTDALDLINSFGPEHLQLMVRNNHKLLKEIRNAGAIFLGSHTPVAYGDYFAGPSHTLPTGGTSRFFSGVNVNSFLRTTAVMEATRGYGSRFGKLISAFAHAEGLTAHAQSVRTRLAYTRNKKK